jgi:ferredoxin
MVVITLQREKCIGCNYCVEVFSERFRMSKKDGKSVLLDAENKKGFYTIKVRDEVLFEAENAAKVCPVKIIKVKHI